MDEPEPGDDHRPRFDSIPIRRYRARIAAIRIGNPSTGPTASPCTHRTGSFGHLFGFICHPDASQALAVQHLRDVLVRERDIVPLPQKNGSLGCCQIAFVDQIGEPPHLGLCEPARPPGVRLGDNRPVPALVPLPLPVVSRLMVYAHHIGGLRDREPLIPQADEPELLDDLPLGPAMGAVLQEPYLVLKLP